jgi:hypothetical protein
MPRTGSGHPVQFWIVILCYKILAYFFLVLNILGLTSFVKTLKYIKGISRCISKFQRQFLSNIVMLGQDPEVLKSQIRIQTKMHNKCSILLWMMHVILMHIGVRKLVCTFKSKNKIIKEKKCFNEILVEKPNFISQKVFLLNQIRLKT